MQSISSVAEQPNWPAPASLVALFASAQIVLWTLAPSLTHSAPPIDVVEGYMWGREWLIATYKHPALPSWFLEASRLLTGTTGWPAYLTSQLFIAASFGMVFLLGRDMMGPERAAAGTLMLAGVTYYMWPTSEFNHNIASTPFWAGIVLVLWRALERQALIWWLLLGAFAAGALYAKLSAVFLLLPVVAWMLCDRRSRAPLASPGPWLGLTLFALLATPLAVWLVRNDFAPLRYAAQRWQGLPTYRVPLFLFDTAANIAGIFVMLMIAGLIGPWRKADEQQGLQWAAGAVSPRARGFLLFFTVAPLALTVFAAVLSRAGLKTAWGSSMFNTAGLLAIALTAGRYTPAVLRRIGLTAACLMLTVPLAYGAVIKLDATLGSRPALRVNWPQRAIGERLGEVWLQQTGQPLRIVAGGPWLAGLVGLTNRDTPSILSNGDLTLSPWITADRIDRQGLLAVWEAGSRSIPPPLLLLIATRRWGEENFNFPGSDSRQPLVIGYAVVPPKAARPD
jgi:4-amino-4-deoxy-L-arabinose transferase-like glycosyltransferase